MSSISNLVRGEEDEKIIYARDMTSVCDGLTFYVNLITIEKVEVKY